MNNHGVSFGNNVAMGKGSFKTVNQDLTHWVQPSGVDLWIEICACLFYQREFYEDVNLNSFHNYHINKI